MRIRLFHLSQLKDKPFYWFSIRESLDLKKKDYSSYIKDNDVTFNKHSGTKSADAYGSTIAFTFFSKRFVDILKTYGANNFKEYKIKLDSSLTQDTPAYYLDIFSKTMKRFTNDDKTTEERINELGLVRNNVLILYPNYFFTDFGDWDGSDIFTVQDTKYIIITEKLKSYIENQNLQNVSMKEFEWFE